MPLRCSIFDILFLFFFCLSPPFVLFYFPKCVMHPGAETSRDTNHTLRNCLAFYTGCIIIVGCRKIKEKYHGHSDTNNILYVVHDSERSIAGSLVTDLCLCRRLGLPNTKQMVLRFPRNLQRGDIFVHRTIQDIGHCVQSYSLHSFGDRRINWTSPSTGSR